MSTEFLKGCIADARAVRATAVANARAQLEEIFSPKMSEMLSKQLQQEVEDELKNGDDTVAVGTDPIGSAPAPVPAPIDGAAPVDGGESDIPADPTASVVVPNGPAASPVQQAIANDVSDAAPVDAATAPIDGQGEPEGDVDPVTGQQENPDDVSEVDIDEIIRNLAEELAESKNSVTVKSTPKMSETSPKAGGSLKANTKDPQGAKKEFSKGPGKSETSQTGKVLENDVSGLDDILDGAGEQESNTDVANADPLAELLRELDSECESGDENEEDGEKFDFEKIKQENSDLSNKNLSLTKENKEFREAITYLRTQINEVSLLNAKLIYANRIFKSHTLSEAQKMKVVESFDLTKTVREAKIVFATLNESFTNFGVKQPTVPVKAAVAKVVTEGMASKAIGSTKPSKQPELLTEGAQLASRLQKLAGIRK